ncbi:MAG: hypothetical protein HKN09_08645 [Saprospiraceae bacterium]|nr:hypothetical protein [Saprospiraceae bacterium]
MRLCDLNRGVALAMAFMVMISTSGLSMDAHFCSGKVKRISFYTKAKTCKEVAASKKSCCSNKRSTQLNACSNGLHDKGCCSNESIRLSADFDFIKVIVADVVVQFPSAILELFSKNLSLNFNTYLNKKYLNFKPPLLQGISLSLLQVYRL